MMTRKKVSKGRDKKQSRRIKYGGRHRTSLYSHEPISNDELFTIELNDDDAKKSNDSKKTDKSETSNDNHLLIGGIMIGVVAFVVGITVSMSKHK
jgi:hypothetical protein